MRIEVDGVHARLFVNGAAPANAHRERSQARGDQRRNRALDRPRHRGLLPQPQVTLSDPSDGAPDRAASRPPMATHGACVANGASIAIPFILRLRILLASSLPPGAVLGEGRVPTPESVFGFRPGADYKLATYDQSIEYFKKLDGREQVREARRGRQDQPGPADVLRADLERPRTSRRSIAIARSRCASRIPQGLTEAEARQLAREGKAFVHIDGGLHSTEVAGPQHTPLLAYDLRQPRDRARDQGHPRQRRRSCSGRRSIPTASRWWPSGT